MVIYIATELLNWPALYVNTRWNNLAATLLLKGAVNKSFSVTGLTTSCARQFIEQDLPSFRSCGLVLWGDRCCRRFSDLVAYQKPHQSSHGCVFEMLHNFPVVSVDPYFVNKHPYSFVNSLSGSLKRREAWYCAWISVYFGVVLIWLGVATWDDQSPKSTKWCIIDRHHWRLWWGALHHLFGW